MIVLEVEYIICTFGDKLSYLRYHFSPSSAFGLGKYSSLVLNVFLFGQSNVFPWNVGSIVLHTSRSHFTMHFQCAIIIFNSCIIAVVGVIGIEESKVWRDASMRVSKATETRYRDGSVCRQDRAHKDTIPNLIHI